jgi:hypothetical protein
MLDTRTTAWLFEKTALFRLGCVSLRDLLCDVPHVHLRVIA